MLRSKLLFFQLKLLTRAGYKLLFFQLKLLSRACLSSGKAHHQIPKQLVTKDGRNHQKFQTIKTKPLHIYPNCMC